LLKAQRRKQSIAQRAERMNGAEDDCAQSRQAGLQPDLVRSFCPMFIYELAMFLIGKRKYSKRQIKINFDYGYNPLIHGRKETEPKHPDVWAYALEKTYEQFSNDERLAALMGILYRFREPTTTEEFDQILSDHISALRREPDLSGNMAAVRLWNPANVVGFLDEYYKKHGFGDFTHYYVNEKGVADEWKIIKLGTTGFKPREYSRPIPYYSEYLERHTGSVRELFVLR
jgi:hypothetical protein